MSATNRGAARVALDFYRTPAWAIDAILPTLPRGGRVLEPGCGDGAVIERLFAAGWTFDQVTGIELDPERAQSCFDRTGAYVVSGNFLELPLIAGVDVVVGNPPYGAAEAFARCALETVAPRAGTVALLLRAGFASSMGRRAFHREHPSDRYALPRRPSFAASYACKTCGWRVTLPVDAGRLKACPTCASAVTCTTTDSAEYEWFVWGPGRGGRWFILDVPEAA